jgi:hypothetical protein
MSTQLRSDLKSIAPASVSRNAMNPFGAKEFTALAATLSPVGWAALEALIATAPYRQSGFREDLAEYVCAAPLATDNAAIAAGHFKAPTSALKTAGLRSRTALRGKPRTSEGCQDLASVEELTVALRRARDHPARGGVVPPANSVVPGAGPRAARAGAGHRLRRSAVRRADLRAARLGAFRRCAFGASAGQAGATSGQARGRGRKK